MLCTNKKCRRETDRMIVKVDAKGKVREGCPKCLPLGGTPHLYSGKKIWSGDDVYGREGCREKNLNWFKGVQARSQRNQLVLQPSSE